MFGADELVHAANTIQEIFSHLERFEFVPLWDEAHEDYLPDYAANSKESVCLMSMRQVDGNYPKAFVWACQNDELVPVSNAVRMGEALKAANVPHKLKIYPTGGHGCGTAEGTSAEPWMSEMLEFMDA